MDFKTFFTFIIIIGIIIGCKTKEHVIYQSRANIEFKSDIKKSQLTKIELSEDEEPSTSNSYEYSVFHAIDNGITEYILFVPTSGYESTSIEAHQYSLSIPFPVKKADQLLKVLNSNIKEWDQNMQETKGKFTSFNYTPAYETVSTSDSTFFYSLPSFSYNFSKSAQGNSFSISIIQSGTIWNIIAKEKEKLIRLRDLIQKARNKIIENA